MVTNSVIVSVDAQADGRRYVMEQHTDDRFGLMSFQYLASGIDDINAELNARAEYINNLPDPVVSTPTTDAVGVVSGLIQTLTQDQQLAVFNVAVAISNGDITPEALLG